MGAGIEEEGPPNRQNLASRRPSDATAKAASCPPVPLFPEPSDWHQDVIITRIIAVCCGTAVATCSIAVAVAGVWQEVQLLQQTAEEPCVVRGGGGARSAHGRPRAPRLRLPAFLFQSPGARLGATTLACPPSLRDGQSDTAADLGGPARNVRHRVTGGGAKQASSSTIPPADDRPLRKVAAATGCVEAVNRFDEGGSNGEAELVSCLRAKAVGRLNHLQARCTK